MEGKNNGGNYNNSCTKGGVIEKKQGRAQEQVNCPRCNSSNTKFCYYNNYSLTQPRYFCKTCRRYWTEGGSLRNVPVGGGSRKNKKFNNISSSSSSKLLPDLNPSPPPSAPTLGPTTTTCPSTLSSSSSLQNPKILMQGGQDLNLAFSPMMEKYDHHHGVIGIGIGLSTTSSSSSSSSSSSNSNSSSALELLRGLNSNNNYGHDHHHHNNHPILMMPNSNSNSTLFPSGFSYHHHPMQEVKPTSLGFSVDHHHAHQFIGSSRYGVHQEDHHISSSNNGDGGRLSFPFGDVKQIPEATHHVHEVEQNKEQGNSSTTGFWTGMIGEGSW